MAKKLKVGKSFTYQVGVPSDSSDPSKGPSGNPSKVRSTATYNHVSGVSKSGQTTFIGTLDGAVAAATASVTVGAVLEVATGDTLILGDYELIEGVHWEVGADAGASAANLAASISKLKGFSAEVNGAVAEQVDITGPTGPSQVTFKLIKRSGNNSVSPDSGYMTIGGPSLKGPTTT